MPRRPRRQGSVALARRQNRSSASGPWSLQGRPLERTSDSTAANRRAKRVLAGAPEGFAEFSLGHGARTPLEILAHISDVLTFALRRIENSFDPARHRSAPDTWEDELSRFRSLLDNLENELRIRQDLPLDLAQRLIQGPFADALTHVGQIALLARCAGGGVPAESYFDAEI